MSRSTNGKFKCRNFDTTCDAKWVIYCISCPICNLQYVGQTNNLRIRMNAHKSDLLKCVKGGLDFKHCTELYKHLKVHSPTKFYFQILDVVHASRNCDRDNLLDKKEREWIWNLDCIYPKGLNVNDGFNCQAKKRRARRL